MTGNDIRVIGAERCCGCAACENACPADALSMAEGAEGFLFPRLDEKRCIGCGKCLRACPVSDAALAEGSANRREPKCFAAAAEDAVRMTSSSGGIFRVLAQDTLERGGTVYGAAWRADLGVGHARAENAEELFGFSGSKYVQSRTAGVYRMVKRDLDAGRPVLFSGTPCQNAGLLRFLKKDYEGLLTADIVCHGVPSEALFFAYLEETFGKGQAAAVSFRSKERGQSCTYGTVTLRNGRIKKITADGDPYEKGFHKSLFLRRSCYACPFAAPPRPGDFTLGDFWGLEKTAPQLADARGVSEVLLNSDKAEEVWERVKGRLSLCEELPLSAAVRCNRYRRTTRHFGDRERFFLLLPQIGFRRAVDCALDEELGRILAGYPGGALLPDQKRALERLEKKQRAARAAAWLKGKVPTGIKRLLKR